MKITKFIKYPKYPYRVTIILFLILLIGLLAILILDYTVTKSGLTSVLNLDHWDWLALIVASFSLGMAILTWWSQDQTRENTTRLDTNDYRDILVGGFYNIVRNTINLYSLSVYMEDKYSNYYPSEEYLQKLKIYLFDVDQIPSQNIPKCYRGKFQRIAELSRYFNLHIDSTQKHLNSKLMPLDIKKRDMETLKAMHWLLASELMKIIDFICPKDTYKNGDMVRRKISEVVNIFCPNDDYSEMREIYIGKDDVKFLYKLYDEIDGYDEFLMHINDAIKLHLEPNSQGQSKIPAIPFN